MRSRYGRTIAATVALLASATLRPQAQTPAAGGAAPFDIVGFIDAATVTPEADGFSGGGMITVNGTNIIVPKNTLLQMPAFALTWQEVFTMAPDQWKASGASGLAKSDTPPPLTTYEVHIQGNRIVDAGGTEKYIAGPMFIAQQSLNAGAGYINSVNPATGEIRVGGTIGDATSGARVIINDPQGKFAPARSDDPRFTIDEDNPTVRSETGYPMCIPHGLNASGVDPCPQSNRPKNADGTYQTVFTMDATPDWAFLVPPGTPSNGTNPLMMAPFEVGDYVTYSGNLSSDANGSFVLAHTVIANVGIFTQPGTQPTYVAVDTIVMGVGGAPNPNLPQEATVRTKIEGFTTDPSSFVMLSALDVDPCNGSVTERFYDMVAVDPGLPVGAVAGRWRWRPNSDAVVLPPTRMIRATSINGQYFDWNTGDSHTPSGLEAGIYSAPNFEFIFPENLGIGNPPVPSNFQDFPFLVHGSGAYYGANGGPAPLGILGQLNPWPGAVAPAAAACPSGTNAPAQFTPVADAGPSLQVNRGATVTLDGSISRDTTTPSPMPLTFAWSQVVAGVGDRIDLPPGVGVVDAAGNELVQSMASSNPQITFTVDKLLNGQPIADNTTLTFKLVVSNCQPWSDPGTCGSSSATMTITITPNAKPTDVLSGVTATWRVRRSRLDVSATTSDPTSVLTVLGFGDMGPALPTAPGVPADPTARSYTQVGVNPHPDQITVRSSLGAIVTVPVTVR